MIHTMKRVFICFFSFILCFSMFTGYGICAKADEEDQVIHVSEVILDYDYCTVFSGETQKLTATVFPEDATDKSVIWYSDNQDIAEVDESGIVYGKQPGDTTITVTTNDGGYSASCSIWVEDRPPITPSVELNKHKMTLRVGQSETLIATVSPSDFIVDFQSDDTNIAIVDNQGKVTAIADEGIAEPSSAVIWALAGVPHFFNTDICIVTVEDPINAFIRRLYKLCFGRNADKSGFTMWTDKLRSGKSTAAYVAQAFFTSREMKNMELSNDEFVERCYQVMMDRASDAGGKKNWVSKLDIGMSQTYVLRGFIASREFSKICADYGITVGSISLTEARDQNQGITEFVSRCYSEVLGRKADTGGLNDWCNRILTASSRKQAAINAASNGFFHSEEYMNKHTSNDQYVRTLYRTFLGREADQGGYNDWMNKLRTGTSRDSVMKGFANSTEFANIMANYGIK